MNYLSVVLFSAQPQIDKIIKLSPTCALGKLTTTLSEQSWIMTGCLQLFSVEYNSS